MVKKIISALKVVALSLFLAFGVSYVSAWTAPTAVPPTGNVAAPINVSATAQAKAGKLTLGGLTTSDITVSGSVLKYTYTNSGNEQMTSSPLTPRCSCDVTLTGFDCGGSFSTNTDEGAICYDYRDFNGGMKIRYNRSLSPQAGPIFSADPATGNVNIGGGGGTVKIGTNTTDVNVLGGLTTGGGIMMTSNNNIIATVGGAKSNYGAITVQGDKGGYSGIHFKGPGNKDAGTLMMSPSYSGFFDSTDTKWRMYVTDAIFASGYGKVYADDYYIAKTGKWASQGGAGGSTGSFQLSAYTGACWVVNSKTGGCSCPAGSTAKDIGVITGCSTVYCRTYLCE